MSYGCGAPVGNTPVVDNDGNVFPCIYLVGMSKYDVGNIFTDEYPNSSVYTDMKELLNIENMKECNTCVWRFYCGGGCPIGKLLVSDNPKATPEVIQYTRDVACKTTKKMVEILLWKYADESSIAIDNQKMPSMPEGVLDNHSV